MKYNGQMSSSEFLLSMDRLMGGKSRKDLICCSCTHFNGECFGFAQKGACKAYDKYSKELKELEEFR